MMERIEDEFAVLLKDVDAVQADLARNLLEQAGIPSMLHGPDFDVAELGRAAHAQVRGRSVLVPPSALERARAILEEAWGSLDPPAADAGGD